MGKKGIFDHWHRDFPERTVRVCQYCKREFKPAKKGKFPAYCKKSCGANARILRVYGSWSNYYHHRMKNPFHASKQKVYWKKRDAIRSLQKKRKTKEERIKELKERIEFLENL